jgi:hypothetical protein
MDETIKSLWPGRGIRFHEGIVAKHPATLYLATLLAAVVAASGKQAIDAIWGKGWNWVSFSQDLFTNAFIAVILAVIARSLQKQQDRAENRRAEVGAAEAERQRLVQYDALRLAMASWSELLYEEEEPHEERIRSEIWSFTKEAEAWGRAATTLREGVLNPHYRKHHPDTFDLPASGWGLEALRTVVDIARTVGSSYHLRERRLLYMQWLANDLAPAEAGSGPRARAAYNFRNEVVKLAARMAEADESVRFMTTSGLDGSHGTRRSKAEHPGGSDH